jgi:hypothetical protein
VLTRCHVDDIVTQVYALDAPWRTRFLEVIAGLMGEEGAEPDRDQVTQWLMEDAQLRSNVTSMLHSWRGGHFW